MRSNIVPACVLKTLRVSDDWPDEMKNTVGAGVTASTAIAAVAIILLAVIFLYIMCNDCGEDRYVMNENNMHL